MATKIQPAIWLVLTDAEVFYFKTAIMPPTDLAAGRPFPRTSCYLHG